MADLTSTIERLLRGAGWEVLFSTVVFLVVVALSRLLRNASPVLLHALWGLVLIRLLLPIDLSSPVSLAGVVSRLPVTSDLEATWLDPLAPVATPADSTLEPRRAPEWVWLCFGLWGCGAWFVGGRLIRRRRRYRRMTQSAAAIRDPEIVGLTLRWRRSLKIRRRVRLVSSDDSTVPFTIGSLRPIIFVPEVVVGQRNLELIEHVVAHELAHIKRWDDLLVSFQTLVSLVYFFHPVVWYVVSRMRAESERICDSLVLRCGRLAAPDYGRSVIAVLRLNATRGSTPIPTFGSDRRRLRMRLISIMKTGANKPRSLTGVHSLVLPLSLALFLLPLARPATVAQSQVSLINPMPGSRVTAPWGPMTNPFTGEETNHRGIDIVGGPGARIIAPADGRVREATTEYSGGAHHGTVIILDHAAGVATFYSHLGSLAVATGERVRRGAVLGTQGSTGEVTGPHLHFEVWVDGEPANPAKFVADWR